MHFGIDRAVPYLSILPFPLSPETSIRNSALSPDTALCGMRPRCATHYYMSTAKQKPQGVYAWGLISCKPLHIINPKHLHH
jgi:hypothetical protein